VEQQRRHREVVAELLEAGCEFRKVLDPAASAKKPSRASRPSMKV